MKSNWWILGGTAVVAGGIGVLLGRKYAMATTPAAGKITAGSWGAHGGHGGHSGHGGHGSHGFIGNGSGGGWWWPYWPYYSVRSECDDWMSMILSQKQEFVRARVFPGLPLGAMTAEQLDQVNAGVQYIDTNCA